jgi:hypothetical protein
LGGGKRGSGEAPLRCLREVVVIRSAMAEQDDLLTAAGAIPALVNGDEALLRRGRYLDVDLMLEIGAVPCYITVRGGRVTSLETGPLLMPSWSFAIRGSENAWRQFWRPLPPPHFHDVFALAKTGEFRIEGDLYPFMSNLLYFKGLIGAPRRLAEGVA